MRTRLIRDPHHRDYFIEIGRGGDHDQVGYPIRPHPLHDFVFEIKGFSYFEGMESRSSIRCDMNPFLDIDYSYLGSKRTIKKYVLDIQEDTVGCRHLKVISDTDFPEMLVVCMYLHKSDFEELSNKVIENKIVRGSLSFVVGNGLTFVFDSPDSDSDKHCLKIIPKNYYGHNDSWFKSYDGAQIEKFQFKLSYL